MGEILLKLIERINEIRAAAVSIGGAAAGTVVGVVETASQPNWFTSCAPYFQVGAWCVAIIAGTITIIKSFRNGKENKRKHGRR